MPTPKPVWNGLLESWGDFRKFMEPAAKIPDDPKLQIIYLAGFVAGAHLMRDGADELYKAVADSYRRATRETEGKVDADAER